MTTDPLAGFFEVKDTAPIDDYAPPPPGFYVENGSSEEVSETIVSEKAENSLEMVVQGPSGEEVYAMMARADSCLDESLGILMRVRDEKLYKVIGYETFDECCRKRLKKTGVRVNQLIKAFNQIQAIPENLKTIVSGMPEGQLRELNSVPNELKAAVLQKADEIARHRPAPTGVALQYAKKDEEGNPIPKRTAADIAAAREIVLRPGYVAPPPDPTPPLPALSPFDRELLSPKPVLPPQMPVQSESHLLTAPSRGTEREDAEEYAATEEEARAIARGDIPIHMPADVPEEAEPAEMPADEANREIPRHYQPFKTHFRLESAWYNTATETFHANGFDKRFNPGHFCVTLVQLAAAGVPVVMEEDDEEESA